MTMEASISNWTTPLLLPLVLLLGILIGCVLHARFYVKVPAMTSVATQGPTTYTALRGVEQPRYQPLPDNAW